MIFDPAPPLPIDDPIYRLGYDAVVLRNAGPGLPSASTVPNVENHGWRQLRIVMLCASTHPASRNSVSDVLGLSITAKMRGVYALRIVALVQDVQAIWNRAVDALPRVPVSALLNFVVTHNPVTVALGNLTGPFNAPVSHRSKVIDKAALERTVSALATVTFYKCAAAASALAGVCARRKRHRHVPNYSAMFAAVAT